MTSKFLKRQEQKEKDRIIAEGRKKHEEEEARIAVSISSYNLVLLIITGARETSPWQILRSKIPLLGTNLSREKRNSPKFLYRAYNWRNITFRLWGVSWYWDTVESSQLLGQYARLFSRRQTFGVWFRRCYQMGVLLPKCGQTSFSCTRRGDRDIGRWGWCKLKSVAANRPAVL